MTSARETKNHLLILAGCCLLMVFIIRPWQLYFLNDDFIHIPLDIRYLFERGGFMRPVPNVFLESDKWLYGKNAVGFFTTTLLLHFICCFVLYFFTRKIRLQYLDERLSKLPLIAAVLFVFYPFHAEALMWTICRVATIATIFTLLSLHFYITAAQKKLHLFLSLLFFVIALFTYESMWNALLLFGIICYINITRKNNYRRELIIFFSAAAIFIAYMFVRIKVLSSLTGNGYDSFQENLHNPSFILSNWIKLTARIFTPPFHESKWFVGAAVVSIIFYFFFITRVIKAQKNAGKFLFFLLLAMITGVATAAILGIDTHRNEGDRYLYYASVFYCIFLAVLILVLVNNRSWRLITTLMCCIVFILILTGYQRNYSYASNVTHLTVDFAARHSTSGDAYFMDVPKAIEGSMIFRTGLPEAINWIDAGNNFKKVSVINSRDYLPGKFSYSTNEITWNAFAKAKQLNTQPPLLYDSLHNPIVLNKKDVLFWFTDSCLYKVNF